MSVREVAWLEDEWGEWLEVWSSESDWPVQVSLFCFVVFAFCLFGCCPVWFFVCVFSFACLLVCFLFPPVSAGPWPRIKTRKGGGWPAEPPAFFSDRCRASHALPYVDVHGLVFHRKVVSKKGSAYFHPGPSMWRDHL